MPHKLKSQIIDNNDSLEEGNRKNNKSYQQSGVGHGHVNCHGVECLQCKNGFVNDVFVPDNGEYECVCVCVSAGCKHVNNNNNFFCRR